jgi:putative hydrolase of the HAD superfamily
MRGMILDLDDSLYPRADFLRSGFAAIARYVSHSWRCDEAAVFATLRTAHADGRAGRELQAVCEAYRLPHSVLPTLITVFRRHVPTLALRDETRRALAALRQDGWRLVVLTNGDPAVQRGKVAALALEPLVDAVVYAEEHAVGGKPDPAAFRAALDRIGLPPSRCIVAGDDPVRDIDGARRLGLRTIRITSLRNDPPALEADAVVAAAAGLPACARLLLAETADAA